MRFPGTITVPDATFEKTLEYATRSFRRAGFRDIVFLGDHGGYQKSEVAVASRLNREWHAQDTRVHAIEEFYRATETAYVPMLKRRGFSDEEIGSHAGLADTALTLALAPDLVRTESLASAGKPSAAQGVHGDPRRATAELGQLGVDIIIAQTIEAIRKATRRQ
jgi:creatinine amidohydrolase/Fe(II)-dependent formamide hydrolase-like protein